MVRIIFDSSTLISCSSSCLIKVLKELALKGNLEIIIPPGVEKESIKNPLKVRRFKLSALRVKSGIDEGWIKVEKINNETRKKINEMKRTANLVFSSGKESIEILHKGESEILGLALQTGAKAIAMDERTIRMLIEDPRTLKTLLEYRYEHKIKLSMHKDYLNEFLALIPDLKIIRSSELIALAYEEGFLEKELVRDKETLEAALYSLKYAGCAVSEEEIEKYIKTFKVKK